MHSAVAVLADRADRRALAQAVPLFLPAIPFGFVLGLAMTESEMPLAIGWATSPLVFAGAARSRSSPSPARRRCGRWCQPAW